MIHRSGPRPGGRSARVQEAVHQAVRELEQELGRSALTVPAIAQRAGVTPSTIYRRWGDLSQLLADVAVTQMRPEAPPADTGAFKSDLVAWLQEYFEEISSGPGRAMLRDVLGTEGHERTGKCDGYVRQQLEEIRDRAMARGEQVLETDQIVTVLMAPWMYRLLFANKPPTADEIERGVESI